MRKIMQLMMAVQTITTLCFGQPFKAWQPAGKTIQVHFYKNVEFLGLVFFMGSMAAQYEHDTTQIKPGLKKKDWFAYDLSLYKQYSAFQNNKHLATAARFAENMQGSDLFPFLIQLEAFPRAKITTAISPDAYAAFSEKGDTAEAHKKAGVFLDALNTLYTAMNFDAYFKQYNNLYEQALQEIKSQLPSKQIIPGMEKFYRQRFDQYILLPSLTIPSGMAFASGYTTANRKTRIFNAFGPFAVQHFTPGDTIDLGFADEKHLRELSIHEFGHSFTNPVLNKIPAQQITGTKALYDTIKTAMDNQGYNIWKSCLYEHFVRAGEIVIARNLGRPKEAEQLQAYYIQGRQFIYLPIIIAELEKYNSNPAISYLNVANAVMDKLKGLLKK